MNPLDNLDIQREKFSRDTLERRVKEETVEHLGGGELDFIKLNGGRKQVHIKGQPSIERVDYLVPNKTKKPHAEKPIGTQLY